MIENNGRTKFEIELQKDVEYIKKSLDELKKNQNHNFVTKAEFEPIKKIIYGLVGLILAGVVTSILAVIFL